MATASIVALIPTVAPLGLGVVQFWSMAIEAWFLRNGHVSFRAFEAPAIAHGWIAYAGCVGVCAAVASRRFAMTALTASRSCRLTSR